MKNDNLETLIEQMREMRERMRTGSNATDSLSTYEPDEYDEIVEKVLKYGESKLKKIQESADLSIDTKLEMMLQSTPVRYAPCQLVDERYKKILVAFFRGFQLTDEQLEKLMTIQNEFAMPCNTTSSSKKPRCINVLQISGTDNESLADMPLLEAFMRLQYKNEIDIQKLVELSKKDDKCEFLRYVDEMKMEALRNLTSSSDKATVFENDGEYFISDGNHRLTFLRALASLYEINGYSTENMTIKIIPPRVQSQQEYGFYI